jgi:hypothetical protein
MTVHYQDAQQHLYPEQEYDVDKTLADELLKHGKAVLVESKESVKRLDSEPQFEQAETPPHYGGQKEPELRKDDELHDIMISKPKSKSKRGKK